MVEPERLADGMRTTVQPLAGLGLECPKSLGAKNRFIDSNPVKVKSKSKHR